MEYEDWESSDAELTEAETRRMFLIPCIQCGCIHMRKNMSEKIRGHFCMACCAEYEENLLRKLVASD